MRPGRSSRPAATLAALLLSLPGAACRGQPTEADAPPQRLRVEVLRSLPHDPEAFTQGLVLAGGELYESVGRYGRSALRRLDRSSGEVRAEVALPAHLFGEGLAAVGDRLIQLTWREGVAIEYRRESLAETRRFRYEGEGWGLCSDGDRLFQSDGSQILTVRDPRSFAARGRRTVTLGGQPLARLNELECAEGWVYANVLGSEAIVRIEPESGRVTAVVDAGGLLTPAERQGADVLNGIAYDAETGTFLLTGKLWPRMFEVRFRPR